MNSRRIKSVAKAALAVTTVVAVAWAGAGQASAQVIEQPLGPVMVLAHRGASFDAPEHTFFAYDLAVQYDTDFLECDLQLSKDDVLVCIHDTTVDRTSKGSTSPETTGRVDKFTLAQLRTLDWGKWFNTANPARAKPEYVKAALVPFEEQLDCYLAINPKLRFHVETKAPSEYGGKMEPILVELLKKKGLLATGNKNIQTSTILIQSFELASLEVIKRLAPTLPTVFLWSAPNPPTIIDGSLPPYVDGSAPTSVALQIDPSYVSRAHDKGHEVHTWTVDDPAQMDTLLNIGIDGIFGNKTNLIRERIDARNAGVPKAVRGNPTQFARGCLKVAGTATPIQVGGGKSGNLAATGNSLPVWLGLALILGASVFLLSFRATRKAPN